MKNLRIILLLLIITHIIGCKIIPVEIGDVEKVKFLGVQDKKLSIEISVPIINPNNMGFKITRIDIDIYSNDNIMGSLTENQTLKIKGNSTEIQKFRFDIDLKDALNSGINLLKLYTNGKLDLKLKGEVIVRSTLMKKKFEIDEEFEFRMNQKNNNE